MTDSKRLKAAKSARAVVTSSASRPPILLKCDCITFSLIIIFLQIAYPYIEVIFGIEFTSQYNQTGRSIRIGGYDAELDEDVRNVGWVIFKPSVTFRFPEAWESNDRFYRLWFQLTPGISLACPLRNSLSFDIVEYHGMTGNTVDYQRFPNRNLQWFYWNARASINFAIDRVIIGAGYYISNLDYYSCRRNVELPDNQSFYIPAKQVSQSVYLSVGYSF